MTRRFKIDVLGELQVKRDGQVVTLPPSRKTRALLAYLAVVGRPQRRERLCEIFWEIPDSPRGALRWSLSKIRQIAGKQDGDELVHADRKISSNFRLVLLRFSFHRFVDTRQDRHVRHVFADASIKLYNRERHRPMATRVTIPGCAVTAFRVCPHGKPAWLKKLLNAPRCSRPGGAIVPSVNRRPGLLGPKSRSKKL